MVPQPVSTWCGQSFGFWPLMATHSSIHAWRIPWTEEPGSLWSTELQSQTQLKLLSTLTEAIC